MANKFLEFIQPDAQALRDGKLQDKKAESSGCLSKNGNSNDAAQNPSDSIEIQYISKDVLFAAIAPQIEANNFLEKMLEIPPKPVDSEGNVIQYTPVSLDTPIPQTPIQYSPTLADTKPVPVEDSIIRAHDILDNGANSAPRVFYITDLHIEHQFSELFEHGNYTFQDLYNALSERIDGMLSDLEWNDKTGYLLVGGDVSCSKDIVTMFYHILKRHWFGSIVAVLGNHELWDDHPDPNQNRLDQYTSRPLETIVTDYRIRIHQHNRIHGVFLLQNALLINFKNTNQHIIVEEEQLRSISEEKLRFLCEKGSYIILGGIGFSGLDDEFNASNESYRAAVTSREKDIELAAQFEYIHEKVRRCAGDMQVIVFTHTPVLDWLSKPENINTKWIYINGHTHANSIIRKNDGTTILSDNQIGYKPKAWRLNSFTNAGWYDPLQTLADGIHEISYEKYREFHNGRGIYTQGFNFNISPQTIFALKKNNLYMFILKSTQKQKTKLYLLRGGTCKGLDNNDIDHYYDNMEQYAKKVREAIAGYQNMLTTISKEIQLLGGEGTIHGCIVDIDSLNHIYLNVNDFSITPYHSPKFGIQYAYSNIGQLLKKHAPRLLEKYARYAKELPLLTDYAESKNPLRVTDDKPIVLRGTDIYKDSHTMKHIQFLETNIIRIWEDAVLKEDSGLSFPTGKGISMNKDE